MNPSLLIATPARPAWLHVDYVQALIVTIDLLRSRGISCAVALEPGNAVVGMARAELVAQFMASGASHLLAIDADIGWPPEAVLQLLEHDLEFVAVACAHRHTASGAGNKLRVELERAAAGLT